jgi:hypothetical protein
MEPRGVQPLAISGKSDRRRSRKNKPKSVAMGCGQLPKAAHGKERVDGSVRGAP